jgi:prefoldin subunit 5
MDLITRAVNTSPKKKIRKDGHKFLKPVLITVGVILVLFIGLFFSTYFPAKTLISQINSLKSEVKNLQTAVSNKDLDQAKISINTLKTKINEVTQTYSKLKLIGSLPYIKSYYQDGQQAIKIAQNGLETGEILITAIEPYKDFLGIQGGAVSSADTTEDRIEFLTQSVEGLTPYLDTIESKIKDIDDSINQINASKYPDEFKGIALKSTILSAQETVDQIYKYVKDGKPLLTKISWLLGKDSPRKYLVIFQNDGELRPSGGFWTAYSTITINNGKVTPGADINIFDLDDKLKSKTPAPRIISSYHIDVPYLYLRDSNLSPDFPTDAQTFLDQYYKAIGTKEKFDAVVAIDTQTLVDMVSVLGKLDTRVGTFTTEPDKRCDGCPQIIYEIEYIAGRPRNYLEANRKDFMNPLMSALLANVMVQKK